MIAHSHNASVSESDVHSVVGDPIENLVSDDEVVVSDDDSDEDITQILAQFFVHNVRDVDFRRAHDEDASDSSSFDWEGETTDDSDVVSNCRTYVPVCKERMRVLFSMR